MWIAVQSRLTIIMEKHVAFILHYNYFLCVMHPQTLKPFGGDHSFTYRVDTFHGSTCRKCMNIFSLLLSSGSFLCNLEGTAVNFSVIFWSLYWTYGKATY